MNFNLLSAISLVWSILGVLWVAGALFAKPVQRAQPGASRLFYLTLAAMGIAMLGSQWFHRGWMGVRFVPGSEHLLHNVQLTGLALTIAGCLFASAARISLGGNWSGAATVKTGHELIVKGPYAITRHPIYTGLLVAVLGTALAVAEWRGLLGLLTIFLAFAIKMSQEERLMLQTFPQDYPLYQRQVKALIPGLF
jgi:protein-S-isoprenylcysteine O-methyltransferase Ste14